MHIVGHSLGAHISGYVGDIVQDNNDGEKVGRITGLDPAGPFFDPTNRYPVMQRNLRKTDAAWVDVYHTSMGMKGDSMVDGHVDFYRESAIQFENSLKNLSPVSVQIEKAV